MLEKELKDLFDEINEETFAKYYQITRGKLDYPDNLVYSNRLKRCGGYCEQKRIINGETIYEYKISINKNMKRFYGEKEIKEILQHEMVHLWEYRYRRYSSDDSELFKFLILKFGFTYHCRNIPNDKQLGENAFEDLVSQLKTNCK
jgi:predicted SprT family Zn-dependent metalloprotease